MTRVLYDLDVLRTFCTGVELGSFARAADRLGRSTSAVSAQLKKLESQCGTPLLRKSGRGLVLTEAGETLRGYALRLLELNDRAVAAVRGSELRGLVRLGLQEDLGESVLPHVLGQFARAHPHVRIEASVARSDELRERMALGQFDLALLWDVGMNHACVHGEHIMRLPLQWIGPASLDAAEAGWARGLNGGAQGDEALPLAMLEAPCPLRDIVTAALDKKGLAWRHAFNSASLTAVWAATAAGLGLSVRTPFGLPAHVRPLDAQALGLPALPSMDLILGRAALDAPEPVDRLARILVDAVREHVRRQEIAI
ncbi:MULTISPECIES: LysR family transcriptional regulator [Delftia]|jgi:DNA-binding transcriptional LysR family regulator|uniref:Transcriptional regulator, LysR family n=4 Tax=Pseudomonadati TaxID=3379134 RepID=A9BX46_DELAS|nr:MULTISPECIES: LysR substrate-binding domain-containing protein [Delftia]MBA4004044.1 LysR family transcriptional regulator [Delftia sp.]ABX37031.1 transcriptional regulator, LysR family [Delftia acidovorans SPH-1]KZK31749.1 LysR family transcriptional regulator [Delftia sp. GW456-R20]MBD9580850.1 LysR family transcriptional regulator [Delftia sp. DLF01]MCG3783058.1 LysR substrate-binding domain-containing protein [Delftia acidovorans]